MCSWVWYLKDYQGAIAACITGGLGFYGVIRTLNKNAGIARDARLHTIELEREALRAALLEELRYELKRYSDISSTFFKATTETAFPKSPLTGVYPLVRNRIGLLTPAEVQALFHAHFVIAFAHVQASQFAVAWDKVDQYLKVHPNDCVRVGSYFKDAIEPIRLAIHEFEKTVGRV